MNILQRDGTKIIRSGYAEVNGVGNLSRFSRQWLCLTEIELLFYKDSTCTSAKFHASIPCSSIKSLNCDIGIHTSTYTLLVHLPSSTVHISFKTQRDLKHWRHDLETCLPILFIGEPIKESVDNWTGDYLQDGIDPPSRAFEGRTKRVSSTPESLSDASTLVNRFSYLCSDTTRHASSLSAPSLSGATCADERISCDKSPWISDGFTELPRLLETQTFVDDQGDERPSSPVDPSLVFEAGRIHIDVSRSPSHSTSLSNFVDLTGQVAKIDQFPFATGGFADVWRGEWESEHGYELVAMKVVRSFSFQAGTELKIQRRLKKELEIWGRLQHRHVIPLYGIVYDMGRYVSMVSPWMSKGNASKFFEDMNITESEHLRLKLLCEVASALEYLHCFKPLVVHGDLKAANILINEAGDALLADFGISVVIEEEAGSACFASSSFAGSVRWMAIELLRVEDEHPQLSTHSDVWSFGTTILEVLSGKLPYYHRKNDIQVFHEKLRGLKPRREDYIQDEIWDLLQLCWKDNPMDRPSMSHVRATVDKFYRKRRRMGVLIEVDHQNRPLQL